MLYALIITYLLFLVYHYEIKKYHKGENLNYTIAYLILVALLTLRYRVGGDTINYKDNFDSNLTPLLRDLDIFTITSRQPIPAFIFSFVKTYLGDFVYVQGICAVFVNSVVFWFIKKNTKYKYTALLLYVLCFFMRLNCEIMRESLAISFFLLGYRYLIRKEYLKYYIFIFLAFMSHFSAVFLFLLPFMYSSIRVIWKILLIIFMSISLFIVMPTYLLDLSSMYLDRYSDYESSIFGKLSIIIFQIIIPSIFLKKSKKFTSASIVEGVKLYIFCSIGSLIIYILYRFNNYTVIFYIIMISDLLHRPKKSILYKYLVNNCAYFIIFCYGFISPAFTDISNHLGHPARWYVCWYPYVSVFDPYIVNDREAYIDSFAMF